MTSPLSTARSRPLREVSSRTLAVVTERASATQTSAVSGTAITPNTTATAPCASAITEPTTRASVKSGPMPISEAVSRAPTSGRGRSGSITSRLRVQGLVPAREEQRHHRPAQGQHRGQQHHQRARLRVPPQRHQADHLPHREQQRHDEGRDVGGPPPGRLAQPVAQQRQLEPCEDGDQALTAYGRDSGARGGVEHRHRAPPSQSRDSPVSRAPAPTSSRKASWREAASPRTSVSVPCARIRPAASTATQSQRDSTSSIT